MSRKLRFYLIAIIMFTIGGTNDIPTANAGNNIIFPANVGNNINTLNNVYSPTEATDS